MLSVRSRRQLAALWLLLGLSGCVGGGVSIPSQGKFIDVAAQHPGPVAPPGPEATVLRPLLVSGRGVLEDNALAGYVRTIVARLLQSWPGPRPSLRVYVVPDPEFTAEALEDGAIMITTGTFERFANTPNLATEDALAFLLAHEISHELLGHPAERTHTSLVMHRVSGLIALGSTVTGHTKYAQAAKIGVDIAVGNELGIELADQGLFPSWSRAQEEQADTLGIDLMARAGYSVEAATAVMEVLESLEAPQSARPDLIVMQKNGIQIATGEFIKDALARMARNHPPATDRGRVARKYVEREYGDQVVRDHEAPFRNAANATDIRALLAEARMVEQADGLIGQGQGRQAAFTLGRIRNTPVGASAVTVMSRAMVSPVPVAVAILDGAMPGPHATWPMFILRAKLAEQAKQPEIALQVYRAADDRFGLPDTYPPRIKLLRQMGRGLEATALHVSCITLGDMSVRAACEAANKS